MCQTCEDLFEYNPAITDAHTAQQTLISVHRHVHYLHRTQGRLQSDLQQERQRQAAPVPAPNVTAGVDPAALQRQLDTAHAAARTARTRIATLEQAAADHAKQLAKAAKQVAEARSAVDEAHRRRLLAEGERDAALAQLLPAGVLRAADAYVNQWTHYRRAKGEDPITSTPPAPQGPAKPAKSAASSSKSSKTPPSSKATTPAPAAAKSTGAPHSASPIEAPQPAKRQKTQGSSAELDDMTVDLTADASSAAGSDASATPGGKEMVRNTRRPMPYDPAATKRPDHGLTTQRPHQRVVWMECTRRAFLDSILTAQIWKDAAGKTEGADLVKLTPTASGAISSAREKKLARVMEVMLVPAMRYGIFPHMIADRERPTMREVAFSFQSVHDRVMGLGLGTINAFAPWEQYADDTPAPVSYDPEDGVFEDLEGARVKLLTTYRSYWFRSHDVPFVEIAKAINKQAEAGGWHAIFSDTDLGTLHTTQESWKKVWSRRNTLWQSFWEAYAAVVLSGHCDLLLLLDPAIPLFDQSEAFTWVPDFSDGAPSFQEQLLAVDKRQPWRALYTNCPDQHPAVRSNAIHLLTKRYTSDGGTSRTFEHGREHPVPVWSVPDEADLVPRPVTQVDPDVEEWAQPVDRALPYYPVFGYSPEYLAAETDSAPSTPAAGTAL